MLLTDEGLEIAAECSQLGHVGWVAPVGHEVLQGTAHLSMLIIHIS